MQVTKVKCPSNKISRKCPYTMNPEYITVHNTYNDASAMAEVSYMLSNNNQTSFHYAVDDYRVVQGIDTNRNAWHAGDGNGKGNRKSIGIEICYSKSGGERFIKAEKNAALFIAELLKQRGWGIDRVKKHQDWSGKYCPHRTLDMGWNRFLDMIRAELGQKPSPAPKPTPTPTKGYTYLAYDNVKNKWLPSVRTGTSAYAGNFGNGISGFKMQTFTYRVHDKVKKRWLPWVIGDKDYAGNLPNDIDALQIKNADYRVHDKVKGKWLPWVHSTNDYAGNIGHSIDGIQIK